LHAQQNCAKLSDGGLRHSLGEISMRHWPAFALVFMLFASALSPVAAQAQDIGGNYSVDGTNPNGTTYTGTVTITRQGSNRYRFEWVIANGDRYSGAGTLRDKTISVNWGQRYPVIYQVGDDGILEGTWANGTATETLTPN
jgi:hypothetical protein